MAQMAQDQLMSSPIDKHHLQKGVQIHLPRPYLCLPYTQHKTSRAVDWLMKGVNNDE